MGLVAGQVDGIVLENNVFHDNREEAVYIYGSTGAVQMYNNRFEESGAHISYNFQPIHENRNGRGLEMSGNEFLSIKVAPTGEPTRARSR